MTRIEIILAEPAQTNAYKALLKLDNQLLRSEFVGPVFEDAEVSIKDGFVVVIVFGSDVRYFYPAHSVMRVKESTLAETA
jgi:hypothetical protein